MLSGWNTEKDEQEHRQMPTYSCNRRHDFVCTDGDPAVDLDVTVSYSQCK